MKLKNDVMKVRFMIVGCEVSSRGGDSCATVRCVGVLLLTGERYFKDQFRIGILRPQSVYARYVSYGFNAWLHGYALCNSVYSVCPWG